MGSVFLYGIILVELEGGLYHVIVRGNERRNVFRDDVCTKWH